MHLGVSIRRGILCSAWLLSVALLCVREGGAQLLSRSYPEYTNYAVEGYRRMGREAYNRLTTLIYDEFGTLIMDGLEIYRLSEFHPGFDNPATSEREPGSILRKGMFYYDYLTGLIVTRDTYAGSQQRFIIGDRIRTRFTSLTMDQAALNGIRWDGDFGRNRFSLASSRVDKPIFGLNAVFDYEQGYPGVAGSVVQGLAESLLAAFLLGGYGQTRVGIFDIGMTYVNQFRVDTQTGLEYNSFKGTLPVHKPEGIGSAMRPSFIEYLVVKFADGTDRDPGGARVFDVRLFINGVRRDDIRPVITRHDAKIINPAYPNRDRFFPPHRSIPPYVEFIKGFLPTETVGEEGVLEANGTEYLLYWFKMPTEEGAREVQFDALVANDYEISLSEVYIVNPGYQPSQPESRNRATYFYRVLGSKGRVTDMSNLRWVGFNYGRQTGVTVGGIRISTEVPGFQLSAEYNVNYAFRQYPDIGGRYHHQRASAYYINLKKDIGPGFVGGEVFNISPYYTTMLSIQDVNFYAYTQPYFAELNGSFDERRNNTIEVDLVDDNDDRDPFPDSYFLPSRADNNGVFPGLDADLDGRADTNENNNSLPDYFEPFLLYHVDPEDYAYGEDMNNNEVIDLREDDDKPDYPYDKDSKGVHVFTGARWSNGLHLTLGHLDMHQIIGGGRNWMMYGKMEYSRDVPLLGSVHVVDFLKRVKDSIPNDVFRYGYNHTFGPLGPIIPIGTTGVNPKDVVGIGVVEFEDPLHMRNSLVNTAFIEGRLKAFRGLNLRSNVKVEMNFQQETAFKEANRIRNWTSVVAADYTWTRGKWTIRPQMKYMAQRVDDQKGVVLPVFEMFFYPILRMDYALTPKTVLRFGVQAPSWYHNRGNDSADYTSENYIGMVSNTSSYSGYELSFNAGYQLCRRKMADRSRESEDIDYSLFFIRLIAGLRPSEAR